MRLIAGVIDVVGVVDTFSGALLPFFMMATRGERLCRIAIGGLTAGTVWADGLAIL
jgi:hypothetical protein